MDGFAFFLALAPFLFVGLGMLDDGRSRIWTEQDFVLFRSTWALLAAVAIANLYLLGTRAQSLGKLVVGIKIVDEQGQNAKLWRVLLRVAPVAITSTIPGIGLLVLLADAAMIMGDERRCLHDLLAKTNVVIAE